MKMSTTTNSGYSLFLKLFDTYFGLTPAQFTTPCVQTFCHTVWKALTVLQSVYDHVFPATLKFVKTAKNKYRKDTMYLLIIATSKLNDLTEAERIHVLRKVLVYHYCVDMSALSKEVKAAFKVSDDLRYQSGGNTLRLKAQALQRNPCEFGQNVTKDKMRDLFLAMIQAHNDAAAALESGGKRSTRLTLPG